VRRNNLLERNRVLTARKVVETQAGVWNRRESVPGMSWAWSRKARTPVVSERRMRLAFLAWVIPAAGVGLAHAGIDPSSTFLGRSRPDWNIPLIAFSVSPV